MKHSLLKLQNRDKLRTLKLLVFLAPLWYLYWICYDVVIWNKPLVEVNLTNYVALIASLGLIVVTPKLRTAMNSKTTEKERKIEQNDNRPKNPQLFLHTLRTEENSLREEKQKLFAFKETILRHVEKEMSYTKNSIQSLESDVSQLKSNCEQLITILES